MRTPIFSSGLTGGSLLCGAALALSFATVSHASTSIYGTPATVVQASRYYGFQTWATDTDHRGVTYSITNKPSWATFDARYGHLYGVPTSANVGTYSNIVITASDGVSQASLPAFSITVNGTGSSGGSGSGSGTTATPGAATLNWLPPTENTNGTAITNLAGYTIVYGNSSIGYQSVKVANPGLTSYVLENLAAGKTYYFSVYAYSSSGATSVGSKAVSKTIQ